LRKRLQIDPRGNFHGDGKVSWTEWAEKQGCEVMNSKKFLAQETRIQKQFSEGIISLRQKYQYMKLWYSEVPMLDLDASIEAIIEKYRLPLNYKYHLKVYIIGGEISAPRKNWKANSVPMYNDKHKERSLSITIYSQLSKDEIDELNDYIDWVGKHDLPQYWDFENADLAIQLKEARDMVHRDPDTGREYHSSYADLADEYLHDKSKSGRVRGLIRDLENQQKKRFITRAKK
ncbi:MAG: hypothetical protein WAX25_00960, partial [Minisyncoccia bacterium]